MNNFPLFTKEDLRVYLSKANKSYPEPDEFLQVEPYYKEEGYPLGFPARLLNKHVYVQLTKWLEKEKGALNEHIYYLYVTKEEVLTAGYKHANGRYYIPREILDKRIVKLKSYMMPSKPKQTPKVPTMEEIEKKVIEGTNQSSLECSKTIKQVLEAIEEANKLRYEIESKNKKLDDMKKDIKLLARKDRFFTQTNGVGCIVDINKLSVEPIDIVI